MKKLKWLITLIALFLIFGLNAQTKPEKKAKKIAHEMAQVLSLSKEESNTIYQIQLERFNESQSIEKEFSNDPETKQEKLKELGNKVFNQVKKVLGPERQKQWKEYVITSYSIHYTKLYDIQSCSRQY